LSNLFPRRRDLSVTNGQKFFVSFFQKRKRFFLKKEAKTFHPFFVPRMHLVT